MANNDLDCPVDFVTINEYRARLVAFFVGSLGLLCFLSTNVIIAVFLLADFALRAFNVNRYSPLAIISGWLLKLFQIKPKPVDRAPKRFAACMGLGFLIIITACLLANFITIAKVALVILMIFAALESLASFCAGCHVYSYLKRFGVIK